MRAAKKRYPPSRLILTAALCLVFTAAWAGQTGSAVAQDNAATPAATAANPGADANASGSTTSTIHVVQRGENLFRIAQRYGTTVDAIAQANGIKNAAQLQVGQRLLIPNVAPGAGDAADSVSGSVPGSPTEYVVQPGDSLVNLSLRYATPIDSIARQNNIVNPGRLFVGMGLALQEGSNPAAEIKNGILYTVQTDDNLFRVAARFHMSMAALIKANNLKRASVIFPGGYLVIPAGTDGPALVDMPRPFAQVAMQPAPAEQGRTFSLRLTTESAVNLSGTFMDKPLVVHSDDARKNHIIVFGVYSFTQPGIYTLTLTATDDQGQQSTLTRNVAISDGGYASEQIQLPPSQADLIDPKVTGPENDHIFKVVNKFTAQRYIDGPFGLPCPAPVTSQYGTRRSYNGGPYDQFHTGTDFAAAPGSPIYAPAAGVVVMTDTLHVRGNATIIDHGWGIYTGYWHQTEFKVKVGDIVKQGQIIGLVGDTGRVTGPHLHWELFVGGMQVDPLQWVRQSFP